MNDIILATCGLSKQFGGLLAVRDVSLQVQRGTIHGLIGPNGAGKTTCFNLLSKFLEPTDGTIHYDGIDVTSFRPEELARIGLIRSFQISATFPALSVLDNILVALQGRSFSLGQFLKGASMLDRFVPEALDLLEQVGLVDHATSNVQSLSYGHKRALEIATTLAMDPKIMLLDEPTAGMTHSDVDRIIALVRKVASNRTVLLVEHNLKVVENLCDRITVMTRGSILAEGRYHEVSNHPKVIEAYLGSSI